MKYNYAIIRKDREITGNYYYKVWSGHIMYAPTSFHSGFKLLLATLVFFFSPAKIYIQIILWLATNLALCTYIHVHDCHIVQRANLKGMVTSIYLAR